MDIGIDNYLHKKFKKLLNLEHHHQFHQQKKETNEKENNDGIDEKKLEEIQTRRVEEVKIATTETKNCYNNTISETNITNIHSTNKNNSNSDNSKIINIVPNQSTNSVTVVSGPRSSSSSVLLSSTSSSLLLPEIETAPQSSISPENNNNNNRNGNIIFSNSCISYGVNDNDKNDEKYLNGFDENLKMKMTKINCSSTNSNSNCTSSIIVSNSSYQIIKDSVTLLNKKQQQQHGSASNMINGPLLPEQMDTSRCNDETSKHLTNVTVAAVTATAAVTTTTTTTTTTPITSIDRNPSGKYICAFCNLACSKPSVLEKHIRAHTNERPFPCEFCGFRFKTRSNLYKHRRSRSHANRVMGNKAAVQEDAITTSTNTRDVTMTDMTVSKHNTSTQTVNSIPGHDRIDAYNRSKPYKPRFHSSSLLVKQFIDVDEGEDVRHTSFRGTDLSHHISQIISKNNSIINSNDPNLMMKKRYFDRGGGGSGGSGNAVGVSCSDDAVEHNNKTKSDSHHNNADEPLNLTNKNRKRCFSELGEPVIHKSLIKELLLKNLSSDMQCPYCKMIFQTVTELELHKLRSCKGKPSPDNARYTRSSSVNVASILTKNKNAFDSMPLFQSRFPMSSPGPFLGKTRLVDSDKSKSFSFDAVNIAAVTGCTTSGLSSATSSSSLSELSTMSVGSYVAPAPPPPTTHQSTPTAHQQKEERRNVKLFGGEVKVQNASGETTSYKIDNQDDSKSMDTDCDYNEFSGGKISENCVIKSRLHTGGTVLTNKTSKEESKTNYGDIIRVYENTTVSPNIDYAVIGKPFYHHHHHHHQQQQQSHHQSDAVTRSSSNEQYESIISPTLGGSSIGNSTDIVLSNTNNSTVQKYPNITDFSQNAIKLMTPNIRQPTVCLSGLISRSNSTMYGSEANLISATTATTSVHLRPPPPPPPPLASQSSILPPLSAPSVAVISNASLSTMNDRNLMDNSKPMEICKVTSPPTTIITTAIETSTINNMYNPINLAINDKATRRISSPMEDGGLTRDQRVAPSKDGSLTDEYYGQRMIIGQNISSPTPLSPSSSSSPSLLRTSSNSQNQNFLSVDKLMDRKSVRMDGIIEEEANAEMIPFSNFSSATSTTSPSSSKSLTIHRSDQYKTEEICQPIDGVVKETPMIINHQDSDRGKITVIKEQRTNYYVKNRGRGRFICEQCGIRCIKPSMLRKHMKTHSNERPYTCDNCNINFKTKENLTKHLKSKTHSKNCLADNNTMEMDSSTNLLNSEHSSIGTDSDSHDDDYGDDDDDDDDDNDGDDDYGDDDSDYKDDDIYPDESMTRQQEHEAAYGLLSLSQKTATVPSSLMPLTITSDIYTPSTLMIGTDTNNCLSPSSSTSINNEHIMTTEEIAYVTKMNYAKNKVLGSSNFKTSPSSGSAGTGASGGTSWWTSSPPAQIVIDASTQITVLNSCGDCTSSSTTISTNTKEISKDKENLLTYLGKSLIRPLTYPYTSSSTMMKLNHNSTIGETNREIIDQQNADVQEIEEGTNKRRKSFNVIEKSHIITTIPKELVVYHPHLPENEHNAVLHRLPVPTTTIPTPTEYTKQPYNEIHHPTLPYTNKRLIELENSNFVKNNAIPTIKLNDVLIQENNNLVQLDRKRKFVEINDEYQNKLPKNNDEVMDLSMSTTSKDTHEDGAGNGSGLFGVMNTADPYRPICRISPFNKIIQPIGSADENKDLNKVFLHSTPTVVGQPVVIHPRHSAAVIAPNRTDLFVGHKDNVKPSTIEYDNSAMETLADVATKRVKLEENTLAKSVATEYLKLATQKDGLDGSSERILSSINSKDVSDLLVKSEGNENCSVCFKSFKPSQLKIHMNIHFLGRQFRCETCSVSFRKLGHLKKHENSLSHHNKLSSPAPVQSASEPRPFKCLDCAVAFRIQGHLAKHLRSKLHILKLECLAKIPFGLYTELERSSNLLTEINTIDADQCLESLKNLAKKIMPNEVNQPVAASPSSSSNDHNESGKNIKLSDS